MRGKNAIKNITYASILQIITIICGFIVPKLIISTYGSKVNGLISSITQFLAYITLIEAGFDPVIKASLYKPIANKNKTEVEKILKVSENIFRKISYIFVLYVIVLCFIFPIILNNSFDNLFTISLIIIISVSTLFEYYFGMTYKLYLQSKQVNYIISIIQGCTLILNTIIIIILIKLNVNIQIVKICSSMIFILRPIIQNIYVKKKYHINLKNLNSDYKIKQKWDALAQHVAYVIHKNTDIIIITIFCDIKEVSVYSIYYLIAGSMKSIICNTFINGIDSAFGDMIAKKEKHELSNVFNLYEVLYLSLVTILFALTFALILPFVKIYTNGVTDVNYIRPIFAYVMVITEFSFVIRQLYYSLVKVSGNFKETKRGAILEVITNIIVSIILIKYGIVGVMIGTLVSTIIRTIDIIIYTSKNILNRSIIFSIKRILLVIIEFVLILIISSFIKININNYITWIFKASIIFIISSIIIICINSIIYKINVKNLINNIRKIICK